MEQNTLREVLLHETKAGKYVKIYDCGWLVGMCYIDYEDLFMRSLSSSFLNKEVKNMKLVKDEDFKDEIYEIDVE